MDELDNLNSKTDSDLRQIAVAFGDFTPEEAQSKTRDELILAITGAKTSAMLQSLTCPKIRFPLRALQFPSWRNMRAITSLLMNSLRT